ncbi:MAG: hypothetical protein ACKVKW_03500 [Flavobacteriales bacterium]|jgi:hypothetical protein
MKSPLPIALLGLFSLTMHAQHEDLTQRIQAFQGDVSQNYEVKTLNMGGQQLGAIDNEQPEFTDHFKFKALEKSVDNIDRQVKFSAYVHIYHFDHQEDLDWAMKNWLKSFMDNQKLRPGRDSRQLAHADPAVIVIHQGTIAVLTHPCTQFETLAFRQWRSLMLTYFGGDEAVVIEIAGCEGPVMWTKNAPDPRDRLWR